MTKACILSSVHPALDNRVFYREALSLLHNGYEVTLVAVHGRDEIKDGIRIIALPKVPRWKRPAIWTDLLQKARQCDADIFLFHDPELLLISPMLRLLTGKPVVYDIHEVYADFIRVKEYLPAWLRYPIAWTFRWLEPLLAKLQNGLIFADDEIAAQFRSFRGPKTTLFNYPSRTFIQNAREEVSSCRRSDQVILYLGSMERNRGSRLMLDAFARVLERIPEAKLMLVGNVVPPDLADEILAGAASLGIGKAFTYAGLVPFEEIGRYLCLASVGWVTWQPVPKNEKNIPTKLFEYMAYRLPIVCSDLPSTRPYVINGRNGFLVEADNPKAHADAIIRLLIDKEASQRMGEVGQDWVDKELNWEAMEVRLLALYEQVLMANRRYDRSSR